MSTYFYRTHVYVTKGEQFFQETGQGVTEIQTLKIKHKEADHWITNDTYFVLHS